MSNPLELLIVSAHGEWFWALDSQPFSKSSNRLQTPQTPSQATVRKASFCKNTAASNKAKMAITVVGEMQAGKIRMFILKSQFS